MHMYNYMYIRHKNKGPPNKTIGGLPEQQRVPPEITHALVTDTCIYTTYKP